MTLVTFTMMRLFIKVLPEGAFGRLWAEGYHNQIASRFPEFYHELAEEVTAGRREGKILDIGTGPAYLPIEIAKTALKTQITGIDISGKMLSIAKKNVNEAGLSHRIALEQGDANHLKHQDDSFDIVVSTGVLFSCKKPARVLNEVYRVLKPGGEAWIYDFARDVSKEDVKSIMDGMKRRGVSRSWRMMTADALRVCYTTEELSKIAQDTLFGNYSVEKIHINEWPLLRAKLTKQSSANEHKSHHMKRTGFRMRKGEPYI